MPTTVYGEHVVILRAGHRDDRARCDAGAARLVGDHNTLVRLFRQTPVHQLYPVDIFGTVLPERQAVEAGDDVRTFVDIGQFIGVIGGHHRLHALGFTQYRAVVLGQPQRRNHPEIHQAVFVEIVVHRQPHIRRGGEESGQKSDTESHNGENGQKPAQALPHLAIKRLTECPFHGYHSILSTGVGFGLTSLDRIVPLLTRMMRSAMPVSA